MHTHSAMAVPGRTEGTRSSMPVDGDDGWTLIYKFLEMECGSNCPSNLWHKT